jgi:hypothetical protein
MRESKSCARCASGWRQRSPMGRINRESKMKTQFFKVWW